MKWNTTFNSTTVVGATIVALGFLIVVTGVQVITHGGQSHFEIFWSRVGMLVMALGAAFIYWGSRKKRQ